MARIHCPSCGSRAVLHDQIRGELICTRCGLVIMEKLLRAEPEWRAEPGKEAGRADVTSGLDITQHDWGLGSRFGASADLSPSWRTRLRRLQMWQRRSRASSYGEKSLREALLELDKLCEELSLPKGLKAEVSSLYRRAKADGLTIGRSTWNILAALTFLTCRLRGVPRTELEVARALAAREGLQEAIALRGIRHLTKLLANRLNLRVPRALPEEYIDRFASRLNLPRRTLERAHSICAQLPEKLKQAKPATLLAAAALYLAGKDTCEGITIRGLAGAFSVGVSSLCQTACRVRELTEALEA